MKKNNYAIINHTNLNNNIALLKQSNNYENYILNVSNHAFFHGMELIKSLVDKFDYLYTTSFNDVLEIRKYDHKVKIIYSGFLDEDNIYDLILNDAILVIKKKEVLDFILSLKIKDIFKIILSIDKYGYNGIAKKSEISDIVEETKENININILGIIADIMEKDYLDFKYIISPLKYLELIILNSEHDKNKIKMSNTIIVDVSVYGINTSKRKLFGKAPFSYKPILEIYSTIDKIYTNKKECIGVIPFGLLHGLTNITKVYINNKQYTIREIKDEYTLINIDLTVKVNDIVTIIGTNNSCNSIEKFNFLVSNLHIDYNN